MIIVGGGVGSEGLSVGCFLSHVVDSEEDDSCILCIPT